MYGICFIMLALFYSPKDAEPKRSAVHKHLFGMGETASITARNFYTWPLQFP